MLGLTEAVWSRQGIVLREGCYWYLQGIEVTGAYNEGFRIVNGSHNTFDRCVAHHNGGSGFSMSFGHEKPGEPLPNPDGEKAAWNTFVNCDSYNNFDWWTVNGGVPAAGTNADGFAVKQGSGRGNRFIGCRAWNNSDDAWDLYECGHAVEMTDCWAWHTGHREDHVDMYADRTGRKPDRRGLGRRRQRLQDGRRVPGHQRPRMPGLLQRHAPAAQLHFVRQCQEGIRSEQPPDGSVDRELPLVRQRDQFPVLEGEYRRHGLGIAHNIR